MKLGVREICDVVLKAKGVQRVGNHTFHAGEPVIYFDTAKTSSLEGAATTVYATGGRGNSRLLAWEGEKTMTFVMEDALISPLGIAVLTGADLIQASAKQSVIGHTTETLEVVEGLVVNSSKPVYMKGDLYAMLLDNNGEMSGVPVKINANKDIEHVYAEADTEKKHPLYSKITLPQVFKANDIVMVDYYVEYKSDAFQVEITPDKFAGYYYLEASTLFRREADGIDLPAEFIIPKVKIQSNFTFAMAASGDPSTFTFTMDAFPDYTKFDKTKKVLACLQVLSADDNYDLGNPGIADDIEYQRYTYDKDTAPFIIKADEAETFVTDDNTDSDIYMYDKD